MDNSHVALVSLELPPSVFLEDDGYRCDRNMSLGMNINSLQKIIKCAGNDDEVTLRADESQDTLTLQFQNKRKPARPLLRIGEQD
jgi:proliferating cell nuclear antigen